MKYRYREIVVPISITLFNLHLNQPPLHNFLMGFLIFSQGDVILSIKILSFSYLPLPAKPEKKAFTPISLSKKERIFTPK